MNYIVRNHETLNGKVCDTTTRVFGDYKKAKMRQFDLCFSCFEETHPQVKPSEQLAEFDKFVKANLKGDVFDYVQDGHTYHTEILILADTEC